MDQATLVGSDVDAGWKVVEQLDLAGLNPKVALWLITPEHEDGRLVLASPKFDSASSLKAYEEVRKVLKGSGTHFLPPLLILKTKDDFIRGLRGLFAQTSDVSGMRLGGQVIGNRFVSDAYVYRVK